MPRHRKTLLLAAAVLAAISIPPRTSRAGLTLVSSSGLIQYATYSTSMNGIPGGPTFYSNGLLMTPGNSFPALLGQTESPSQSASRSSLIPPFVLASSTTPTPNGFVGSNFGSALTAIYAQGSGQQGSFTNQGGVFYDTRTSLADGLTTSPSDQFLASVSYSTASVTFRNDTLADIFVTPAAVLSVKGTVGSSAGSFVAASLVANITFPGASNATPFAIPSIVLAASTAGQTVSVTGRVPGDAVSVVFSNNSRLSGTATSFYSSQVDIRPGQSITIQGVLTLVSDPMSSISISSDFAPGFDGPLPDFGIFADAQAVPEPSTVVLLGSGLAVVGFWTRSRRRSRPAVS